jgi:hypothetical protein
MRLELGNSTDLIKIEPETALFNILYTKKEIDQLIISTGAGFNLPMFLNSVLINGAQMIKLRSTGEKTDTGLYTEFFDTSADNFVYIYKVFNDYANKFAELDTELNTFNNELDTLNSRVDNLNEEIQKITPSESDKKWLEFMQYNFMEGETENDIIVAGELNINANALNEVAEINSYAGIFQINSAIVDVNGEIKSTNIPGPPALQIACAFSGFLFTISHIQNAAFFFAMSSLSFKHFNSFCGLLSFAIT